MIVSVCWGKERIMRLNHPYGTRDFRQTFQQATRRAHQLLSWQGGTGSNYVGGSTGPAHSPSSVLTGTESEPSKRTYSSCLSHHSQTLQITASLSWRHQYQPFFVGFSLVHLILAAPAVLPTRISRNSRNPMGRKMGRRHRPARLLASAPLFGGYHRNTQIYYPHSSTLSNTIPAP
jgi:hypothetical protein